MKQSKPPEKIVRPPLLSMFNPIYFHAAISNFDVLAHSITPSAPVRHR
jgi:hypothetical protein